jgi:tetratricopeptide (TPR) repeat protein
MRMDRRCVMRLLTMLLSLALGSLLAQDSQEPGDWRGWLNRGVQSFKNAQYGDAATDFQKAVDLNPSDTTSRLYLATTYLQQYIPGAESPENLSMAQRADAEFRAVLAIDSNNGIAMASLASLELNQKKFDDARDWYQRLINVAPNNADAYYSMGFIALVEVVPGLRKGARPGRPEAGGPRAHPGSRCPDKPAESILAGVGRRHLES